MKNILYFYRSCQTGINSRLSRLPDKTSPGSEDNCAAVHAFWLRIPFFPARYTSFQIESRRCLKNDPGPKFIPKLTKKSTSVGCLRNKFEAPKTSLSMLTTTLLRFVIAAMCVSWILAGIMIPQVSTAESDGMPLTEHANHQTLLGKWVHFHEEDPQDGSGREVYRPIDWPMGPSRGRRGIELHSHGRVILLNIAATDGTDVISGSWNVENQNILVIETSGEFRRLVIEQATRDRLVLRELR